MEKQNPAEGTAYTKQRSLDGGAESREDGVGGETGEVEGRQLAIRALTAHGRRLGCTGVGFGRRLWHGLPRVHRV